MERRIELNELDGSPHYVGVIATDEPGPGGANHTYMLGPFVNGGYATIHFQKGTVLERGVNGVTIEALIAACIDRLEAFQAGDFASDYNQAALNGLKTAKLALLERTEDRRRRGVEGLHKP